MDVSIYLYLIKLLQYYVKHKEIILRYLLIYEKSTVLFFQKPSAVEIIVNNDELPSPNISAGDDASKTSIHGANGSAITSLNLDGNAAGEATPPGGNASLAASSIGGDSKRPSLGNCSAGGLSHTGRLCEFH